MKLINDQNNIIPQTGKWLQYENGENANWLGQKYHNRILLEPINVIIIDNKSKSKEEAISKLLQECKKNGYEEEFGHSAKYIGIINNTVYKQIPNDKRLAFSNKDFYVTNNHGRIIGPADFNGKYVFIAAFSTERPTFINGFKHSFVSFINARNDFVMHMNNGLVYKIIGKINLNNIENSDFITTGDHDGMGIVLEEK